ncbi:MAG: SIMPL domain-containing protein [Candidatus Goldbacteria bacterium]|nr:SIMPL domain-containing protein [Candidatus Goldiibacteriota bacterium]
MRIKSFCFAVVLILACGVMAGADDSNGKRYITVTGMADVKAVPDRAIISFGVNSDSKEIEAAKKDNDTKTKKIFEALKQNGVDEKDIQTDRISIQPRYDYSGKQVLVGYTVTKNITVLLRSLEAYETVVAGILQAGSNYLNGMEFIVSEKRKYADEARALALKAAQEKAKAMAASLGSVTGKPLAIEELQTEQQPYRAAGKMAANVMMNSVTAESESGGTLSAGTVKISAGVMVKFELK